MTTKASETMLRTIIWFIYFWLYQLIALPLFLYNKTRPVEEQNTFAAKAAKNWASRLLKLAGCTSDIKGLENIPSDQAVVFVANHQGAFDIPLMLSLLPKAFGFIAKVELKKLPLVSGWMTMLKCVFITRKNPREAIKAITGGAKLVKEGHSLLIFPEGTRSKTGDLLPFKPGSLKLATKSGAPIVPITIDGSINLMLKDKFKITPAHVTVTVHPAIEITDDYKKDTNQLAADVQAIVQTGLS